ncbi:MAG: RdgB/HAM1 family non-canonical purine pyrophosphatase [Bacteroidota bacterium]|jgi:XTP/dITP diphosphohydrolase
MKVVKLLLATNNAKKVEEIRKILPSGFELLTLKDIGFSEEIPETTNTIAGNSSQKAWFVFNRTGLNCLSDDSGLEIKALEGRPGVDSAHYAGLPPDNIKNIDLVLNEMDEVLDRNARFVTIMTLILEGNEYQFEGEINGTIAINPLGSNGFGYDPIFIPEGYETTFAQMEAVDKNQISHRAKALDKLKAFFSGKQ